MRVCLVYDCLFPWTVGGAERWYRALAERLAGAGHEVTYLTLRQWERGESPCIPGVRVVAVGPRLGLYAGGRRRIGPPLMFGVGVLGQLLRHGRAYDVVHSAAFPYFPLLAVNERDISIAVVGLALGASSLIGVATASLVPRLSRRLSPAQLIGLDLVVVAVSLTALAVSPSPAITIAAVLLFGLQDGIYAVAHNVLVVEVAPPEVKSSFVGLTGTVRNVGKFVAPLAFGGVTVLLTLSQTFVVFAAVAALSSGVGVRVHRVCERESRRRAGAASPRP